MDISIKAAEALGPPPYALRLAQVGVIDGHVTHALSGGGEDRVQYRRRRHEDRGFTNAAPEPARGHHDALDCRHVLHAQDLIGVEVLLFDPAVLDGNLLQHHRAQTIGERALDLTLDLPGVHRMAAVGRREDAVHLQHALGVHRHFRAGGHIATIAHVLG